MYIYHKGSVFLHQVTPAIHQALDICSNSVLPTEVQVTNRSPSLPTMAFLGSTNNPFIKRKLHYWQQGADKPPLASFADGPKWNNLEDPNSVQYRSAVIFYNLLDHVAQKDLSGKLHNVGDMEELRGAYYAYMSLAFVGDLTIEPERYITEAKRQYQIMLEVEKRERAQEEEEYLERSKAREVEAREKKAREGGGVGDESGRS